MTNPIKLKRRAAGGSAGAPASLLSGEVAYNEVDDILYYGFGDDGSGNATSIKTVAGLGGFVALTGAQTVAGVKTFSSFPVTPSSAPTTNYQAANKKYVDDAVTGGSIADGDKGDITVSGSGATWTIDADVISSFGRTLTDDANAAAARATLGLVIGTDVAAIGSPAFTGNPTVPTQSANDNSTKAASTAYVDSAVAAMQAGLDVKQSVRVASTASVTISTALVAGQTIDGVTLVNGDRVLLKDQSTASQNGIYVVSASPARATDADASAEVTAGLYTWVEEGTVNADSGWTLTTNNPITLGTTALTFAQFSGLGQVSAGTGLSKSGNSIQISASYVGQTSITTLGTIATGTWQASVIAGTYGGLGAALSTITDGALLKRSGTTVVTATVGTDYLSSTSTIDGGTF